MNETKKKATDRYRDDQYGDFRDDNVRKVESEGQTQRDNQSQSTGQSMNQDENQRNIDKMDHEIKNQDDPRADDDMKSNERGKRMEKEIQR